MQVIPARCRWNDGPSPDNTFIFPHELLTSPLTQISVMATTFHLFSFVPWELRAHIWNSTVEPRVFKVYTNMKAYRIAAVPTQVESRVVEVHAHSDSQTLPKSAVYKYVVSKTPVPATLQTCREARSLGLYEKCFSKLENVPKGAE